MLGGSCWQVQVAVEAWSYLEDLAASVGGELGWWGLVELLGGACCRWRLEEGAWGDGGGLLVVGCLGASAVCCVWRKERWEEVTGVGAAARRGCAGGVGREAAGVKKKWGDGAAT